MFNLLQTIFFLKKRNGIITMVNGFSLIHKGTNCVNPIEASQNYFHAEGRTQLIIRFP